MTAGVEDRRPVTPGRISEIDNHLPERAQPGTVKIIYQDNELVAGSDGKKYRLRKGPPGRMGASGPEVGGSCCLLTELSFFCVCSFSLFLFLFFTKVTMCQFESACSLPRLLKLCQGVKYSCLNEESSTH